MTEDDIVDVTPAREEPAASVARLVLEYAVLLACIGGLMVFVLAETVGR